MNNFELLKLSTDALLILGLFFLAVRTIRPQSSLNVREIRDLEIVLKDLLRDAETASRSLSDSLGRRQQVLERLLVDIESSERRVREVISQSERERASLGSAIAASSTSRPAVVSLHEQWVEPPSFDSAAPSSGQTPPSERLNAYQRVATGAKSHAPKQAAMNIYGEPISSAPPRLPEQPLAREVEVERVPPPRPEPREDLNQIYDAAEKLLRAGQDLDAVAARTQLPVEDVRRLSQLLIRERQVSESPLPRESAQEFAVEREDGVDARLGVLAPIRRQTQLV